MGEAPGSSMSAPAEVTVEIIFQDFMSRRAALIMALFKDVDEFYNQCRPSTNNLCLYGQSNGLWEVKLPSQLVPPQVPEPIRGINALRDKMHRSDWLSYVAVHSDVWLLAIAYFFGARLTKNQRLYLFHLMNLQPTVFSIVGAAYPVRMQQQSKLPGKLPAVIMVTVEDIFTSFKGRRAGVIKALTTEANEFYQECDPSKKNLCLYGYPDGSWQVRLPVQNAPSQIPEPTLGINFARDGMAREDWLLVVALHTDVWLLAVCYFYGTRLDQEGRARLFELINEQSSLFEIVSAPPVALLPH